MPWHPKECKKKIQPEFEEQIDKSVPGVSDWHHLVEPPDANQRPKGQSCLSIPQPL